MKHLTLSADLATAAVAALAGYVGRFFLPIWLPLLALAALIFADNALAFLNSKKAQTDFDEKKALTGIWKYATYVIVLSLFRAFEIAFGFNSYDAAASIALVPALQFSYIEFKSVDKWTKKLTGVSILEYVEKFLPKK